jgi:hypothetical protein
MLNRIFWIILLVVSAAIICQVGYSFYWWLVHPHTEGRYEAFEAIALLYIYGSPILIGLFGGSGLKSVPLSPVFRTIGRAIPIVALVEGVVVFAAAHWLST